METPAIIRTVKNWYNNTIIYVPTILLVYMGISGLHFASSNLYPYLCTPITFIGILMTPFMIVTPHCLALRWIVEWSGNQISSAWFWLGGYLVYYIGKYVTPYIQTKQNDSHTIIPSNEEKED